MATYVLIYGAAAAEIPKRVGCKNSVRAQEIHDLQAGR
jgi:hypothetical protein